MTASFEALLFICFGSNRVYPSTTVTLQRMLAALTYPFYHLDFAGPFQATSHNHLQSFVNSVFLFLVCLVSVWTYNSMLDAIQYSTVDQKTGLVQVRKALSL